MNITMSPQQPMLSVTKAIPFQSGIFADVWRVTQERYYQVKKVCRTALINPALICLEQFGVKYNNIIFLGLCLGLTTYSALSADSVIKISGRVLDYGCTVSSDSLNFTVDLQKNSARQFPTTGSTSPAVPFQITLSECSKGTTGVRVAFNGIEDAENNTLLKLDEGSNTASGLGIEILDANMRPVKLNDLHAGMQWIPLVPEQNNILPYSARLKSTQKSVNPGLVRASATFTLEFQ